MLFKEDAVRVLYAPESSYMNISVYFLEKATLSLAKLRSDNRIKAKLFVLLIKVSNSLLNSVKIFSTFMEKSYGSKWAKTLQLATVKTHFVELHLCNQISLQSGSVQKCNIFSAFGA
jgi:hypothetical protein